jgi:hypothetical protein
MEAGFSHDTDRYRFELFAEINVTGFSELRVRIANA